MSDFTELEGAIARTVLRQLEGKFPGVHPDSERVIVRDVPLLIERLERAEAARVEAEKLIGQMAEAFARLPEVEAERDRLAKALREIEQRACLSKLLGEDGPCSCASCYARDALAGEEQT